jgi:hypothetical protein
MCAIPIQLRNYGARLAQSAATWLGGSEDKSTARRETGRSRLPGRGGQKPAPGVLGGSEVYFGAFSQNPSRDLVVTLVGQVWPVGWARLAQGKGPVIDSGYFGPRLLSCTPCAINILAREAPRIGSARAGRAVIGSGTERHAGEAGDGHLGQEKPMERRGGRVESVLVLCCVVLRRAACAVFAPDRPFAQAQRQKSMVAPEDQSCSLPLAGYF